MTELAPENELEHRQGLRILHLAFEDPERPGSGGGSVRTYEVNRRLAARHDITVVTARFRGCAPRTDDGVRYIHAGLNLGYYGSIITYYLALPRVVRRHSADLVVEDFGAPVSSVAVPWMTKTPVIGLVQWLFAKQKAAQYHLPFALIERIGVRSHRRLIAVSRELANELQRLNPKAVVDVIPYGIDDRAREVHQAKQPIALYLGRLEVEQKGIDLLLDAWAIARPAQTLVIAGDGIDRDGIQARVERLGLQDSVRLVGRMGSVEKLELLASAQLVCMPSRYETFGIVAIEALACGTPVLAFDIDCLRDVIPAGCGVLVPPFDVDAYARGLAELLEDPERCASMGRRGRATTVDYRWDRIATEQESAYLSAVDSGGRP